MRAILGSRGRHTKTYRTVPQLTIIYQFPLTFLTPRETTKYELLDIFIVSNTFYNRYISQVLHLLRLVLFNKSLFIFSINVQTLNNEDMCKNYSDEDANLFNFKLYY